jgi:hypothetical protein
VSCDGRHCAVLDWPAQGPVRPRSQKGGAPWHERAVITKTSRAFERTSKRRKGYPSETQVKRGDRVVHGHVELVEKLGRNDLCPCGSGRRFKALLPEEWTP